jgi:hypothetical protein
MWTLESFGFRFLNRGRDWLHLYVSRGFDGSLNANPDKSFAILADDNFWIYSTLPTTVMRLLPCRNFPLEWQESGYQTVWLSLTSSHPLSFHFIRFRFSSVHFGVITLLQFELRFKLFQLIDDYRKFKYFSFTWNSEVRFLFTFWIIFFIPFVYFLIQSSLLFLLKYCSTVGRISCGKKRP